MVGAVAYLHHHVAELGVHGGKRGQQVADLVVTPDVDARAQGATRDRGGDFGGLAKTATERADDREIHHAGQEQGDTEQDGRGDAAAADVGVLSLGFRLATIQCQREEVGEVALQRADGGLHVVGQLQLGEIVLFGLEQFDHGVDGLVGGLAVLGGQRDQLALCLAQSAGSERLPLLVDVVAVAADGGGRIVDRRR